MTFQSWQPSLAEIATEHGRQNPDRPAVVGDGETLTWAEAVERTARWSAALASCGVGRGDAVAYLVPNGPAAFCVTLAVLRLGAVAVPLSPMLTPGQLDAMVLDAGARAFVAAAPFAELAETVGAPEVVRLAIGFRANGFRDLERLAAEAAPVAPAVVAPDDPAAIIYSSGTTGQPKGIVHTVAGRHHMAAGLGLSFRFDERSTALVATPIASNATWMFLLPTIFLGGTLVWTSRFDPADWARRLRDDAITHAFGVPLMIEALMVATAGAQKPAPTLRALLSAGSTLRPALKGAVFERFGPVLYELYGLTEGVGTILPPDAPPDRLATVGRPGPGVELKIVDEDGRELPPGETGEIVGRSMSVMREYRGRPEATRDAQWTAPDGAFWLRTGDLGALDARGWLTLKGRRKDMIVSGGLNVYPEDVEAALLAHPDVAEAAVWGVADPKWGETPIAAVVLRPGATADSDALRRWADARLAKHQRLRAVVVRDHLPRNLLGKVSKTELAAEHADLSPPETGP